LLAAQQGFGVKAPHCHFYGNLIIISTLSLTVSLVSRFVQEYRQFTG